jgi:hypothetical protein
MDIGYGCFFFFAQGESVPNYLLPGYLRLPDAMQRYFRGLGTSGFPQGFPANQCFCSGCMYRELGVAAGHFAKCGKHLSPSVAKQP